jgi:hypothetical protein
METAAAAKGVWELGKAAYAGWKWYEKWMMGKVVINHTMSNAGDKPGKVEFSGKHINVRGNYWLVGVKHDAYRPKTKVDLKFDGTWKEWVSFGDHPGEKAIALVWASDFVDAIFSDIRERYKASGNYTPIKMKPPRDHMKVVDAVIINIK